MGEEETLETQKTPAYSSNENSTPGQCLLIIYRADIELDPKQVLIVKPIFQSNKSFNEAFRCELLVLKVSPHTILKSTFCFQNSSD